MTVNAPLPVETDELIVEQRLDGDKAGIVMLTLNRPSKLNPLDKTTVKHLRRVVESLTTDVSVRAIIITGSGTAFSAGGDLGGYQTLYRNPDGFREFMDDFDAVCRTIEEAPTAVLAMINGTCVAGGLELALSCDAILVADDVRIGDGHLRFAQLPGAGGSQRLVRAIGVQQARRWLLTARLFDADEAVRTGLAVAKAPLDELPARTIALAKEMTCHSELAFGRMKLLIRLAQLTGLDEGLAREAEIVHRYATESHDAIEGLNAFAERRPPDYLGR
jgi:enoyl-CoA hydratase/carnithine racemase